MSIDSALICHSAQIPSAEAVVAAIKSYGHDVVLPEGFAFDRRDDGLWRVSLLDGEETGFDYVMSRLADWDEDAGFPRDRGDTLMEFGARGDASVKLVAHVQRAICELGGAHGWIDDELFDPQTMAEESRITAETWDALSAELMAKSASHDYGLPPAPTPPGKWVTWWRESGRWNALGILGGLFAVVLMILYKSVVK